MDTLKKFFLTRPYDIAIIFIVFFIAGTNFDHKRWERDRVIEHDIRSYYVYLPAVFIYNDIDLGFRGENIDKFGELIWQIETPIGKQATITSMGMAIIYSPFFLLAHFYALISGYEADGYSLPYSFALVFSGLFYVFLGLIALKKLLLKFFSPWVTAFTIIVIVIGTNLFYYATHEAAMPHGPSFALIAWFLYLTIRWYDNPGSLKKIIILGLLAGFITLVRPTNIIVLTIFFLWGVDSFSAFKQRVLYFLKNYKLVLLMAFFFILVWVPQFIYWKYISGMFFYFSYGEAEGGFFWHNPQIFNILFSYKKGWFVYTPLMFFAFLGIFVLPWKLKQAFIPILVFNILNIYILASWWSWWFGGGFGLRSFVDSYAIMALPFATLLSAVFAQKRYIKIPIVIVFSILIWFSYFQMRQYNRGAIHYWWMNKDTYWETFLRRRPTERYWQLITIPDYEKARKGIYEAIKPEKKDSKKEIKNDTIIIDDFSNINHQ